MEKSDLEGGNESGACLLVSPHPFSNPTCPTTIHLQTKRPRRVPIRAFSAPRRARAGGSSAMTTRRRLQPRTRAWKSGRSGGKVSLAQKRERDASTAKERVFSITRTTTRYMYRLSRERERETCKKKRPPKSTWAPGRLARGRRAGGSGARGTASNKAAPSIDPIASPKSARDKRRRIFPVPRARARARDAATRYAQPFFLRDKGGKERVPGIKRRPFVRTKQARKDRSR